MSEVEMEETCWGTVTLLVTIVLAAFTYRFFGPDQLVAAAVEKPVKKDHFEQEVIKPDEEEEEKPIIEKEPEKLNASNASSEGQSASSSSGPEFEIINADDVPAVEEIQKMTTEPVVNEPIETPVETAIDEPISSEPQDEEVEVEAVKEEEVEAVTEPIVEQVAEPVQEIPITTDNEPIVNVEDGKEEGQEEPVANEEEAKTPEVVENELTVKSDEPVVDGPVDEAVVDAVDETKYFAIDANDDDTVDEASDVLDKLETAIMEHASTDNESKDMDIEAELLVSDQSHEEHIIIAQQENVEKEAQEPNTDDFKETAAEIVDSVIDSLADFKKEQAVAADQGDSLSVDEREEEKAIQKKQLEEIQKLMEEKGMGEVDPSEQAKLYLDQ